MQSRHDLRLVCGALAVELFHCGDRYAHRVLAAWDGAWHAVAESMEGSADEPWPPSAVLQHAHIEQRDAGPVALLVGMSGSSHWSAAVAHRGDGGLDFDLACRVVAIPGFLGSTYRLAPHVCRQSPRDEGTRPRTLTLAMHQRPLVRMTAADGSTLVQLDDGTLRIAPVGPSPAAAPATIRWRYAIQSCLPASP